MRKPQKVSRRAQSYASARVNLGDWSTGDHYALSFAWKAGYRAAMRDARRGTLGWPVDPYAEFWSLARLK